MKSNLTLLYVEDDKITRDNFSQIFSKYFTNIVIADNGKSALELYEQNEIDIAILDISIPEINGLNVAKKIREKDKKIEIIMLTAFSDKEKLLQAVNLQLFSYLIKPIKSNDLRNVLNELISKLSPSIIDFKYGYSWNIEFEKLFYNGENIKITKNEQVLLSYLCENINYFSSVNDIYYEFYGVEEQGDLNKITQLISRFKKKIMSLYNKESFLLIMFMVWDIKLLNSFEHIRFESNFSLLL